MRKGVCLREQKTPFIEFSRPMIRLARACSQGLVRGFACPCERQEYYGEGMGISTAAVTGPPLLLLHPEIYIFNLFALSASSADALAISSVDEWVSSARAADETQIIRYPAPAKVLFTWATRREVNRCIQEVVPVSS